MSNKLTRFDKIQLAMFSPEEENKIQLSEKDLQIKERYEKVFTYWIQNPTYSDRMIVQFMNHQMNISLRQAYFDITQIKRMLGNVQVASREWHRYLVVEMCRKAYEIAYQKNDPKGMALAADKIGKYTKLDKEELDELPWDQINPPDFEPHPDVLILGIEPKENPEEYRQKLRQKYLQKHFPASETQFEDFVDET